MDDKRDIEARLQAMAQAANLSAIQAEWCREAATLIHNLRDVVDSRDRALGFEPIPDSANSAQQEKP